jgi:hypothetical protein
MVVESERAVQKSARRLLRNIRQYLPGPRLTGAVIQSLRQTNSVTANADSAHSKPKKGTNCDAQ